jgi:2-amino-4-hydroxy-6-hydroxymethyldihydropteridine diphosphokinase
MKQTAHEACLLLGSNIRPEENIPLALDLLQKRVKLLQVSSVWETAAVGSDGPNFLNAALLVSTPLDAQALKERVLHPIEAQLGRVRTSDKNAPRTMDIDIISFDGRVLDAALWTQAHRAVPVAEILPESLSESGEKLKDAALRLTDPSRIRLRTDVAIREVAK